MKSGQASMQAAQVVHCQSETGEVAGTVPMIADCGFRSEDWFVFVGLLRPPAFCAVGDRSSALIS
jgi:hypothetical protein